jgi:RNA polymerase sigma-70 factor (ECF subfamily)
MRKASFLTTDWSTILLTTDADAAFSQPALEKICAQYWYPLYAYARRTGCDASSAEDATQGFLLHVCQTGLLGKADQKIGRFRSFLLASFENYLHSERKRDRALKRGGGIPKVCWDEVTAEMRFALEPCDQRTPERLFERSWAMNLLEHALRSLQKEFEESDRGELFQQLQPALVKDRDAVKYRETAASLGVTPALAKVWVCRMRKRLKEILREQVALTARSPEETERELKNLIDAVSET